jgi:hypothetical protein
MKKIFSLLLMLLFLAASVDLSAKDNKPRRVSKKAFAHSSESSIGRNSKAQFRKRNKPPVIDLTPRNPEKFKTARANPNWKFEKGR